MTSPGARGGAIDIVVNLFTPHEVANNQTGFDANFTSQVRMAEHMKTGVSIDDYLKKMDRAAGQAFGLRDEQLCDRSERVPLLRFELHRTRFWKRC